MNETNCPQTNPAKKTIEIDFGKAILILVSAVLASAGGSVWATLASVNSDHYALAANIKDTESLKSSYTNIIISLGEIKNDLGEIKGQLKVINR